MKHILFFAGGLLSVLSMQSQIGVNTINPTSTLHIIPITTGSSTAEGFFLIRSNNKMF